MFGVNHQIPFFKGTYLAQEILAASTPRPWAGQALANISVSVMTSSLSVWKPGIEAPVNQMHFARHKIVK